MAVTNGTRLACSTGWVTCGFERKLCLLALPRVHLKRAIAAAVVPWAWHGLAGNPIVRVETCIRRFAIEACAETVERM